MTDRIKEIIQSEIDARVTLANALSEIMPEFSVDGVSFTRIDEVCEKKVRISEGIKKVAEIYNKDIHEEETKMPDGRTCVRSTMYIDGVKIVQTEFKEAPVEVTANE